MYIVYVLKSLKNNKRYIGFTSKKITQRLDWHRWGLTSWTRQNGPFELVYTEHVQGKQSALRREKFFKTGNGRKTLELILLKMNGSVSAKELGGPATPCGGG